MVYPALAQSLTHEAGVAVRFKRFAYAVIAAAFIAVALYLGHGPGLDWQVAGLLGALTFLAEWVALPTYFGGTVSLAFALQFAAVLLGGPLSAAIVALAGTVSQQDIVQRKAPYKVLFNGAQLVLSVLASGSVLLLLGVRPLLEHSMPIEDWLAAAIAAAFVQALVNWSLVGIAVAMMYSVSLLEVWKREFRTHLVSLAALTLLGLVLAQLVVVAGPLAVLLLVVPFVVARETLQVYQKLAGAFRDTVRGLVEVLEAKDPYTRGHSERVAVYARETAEELGMLSGDVHTVELAALLHDVGKVGIPATTLSKPDRLSTDEFNEVQLHPITGSSILGDIEFLKEVVPLIEAHHERLDGSGYPYGLRGEAISLSARVLAVADCFDAMTSNRAYRSALSYDVARDELLKGAPRRLDDRCVEALLRRIPPERSQELLEKGAAWESNL